MSAAAGSAALARARAAPIHAEVRDRKSGALLSLYVASNGKPHILAHAAGGNLMHFEPTPAQLRKLRDACDALLAHAQGKALGVVKSAQGKLKEVRPYTTAALLALLDATEQAEENGDLRPTGALRDAQAKARAAVAKSGVQA